jgi:hypothetical protein
VRVGVLVRFMCGWQAKPGLCTAMTCMATVFWDQKNSNARAVSINANRKNKGGQVQQ